MPKAQLPTNLQGWIVAISAGTVGFIAGFAWLRLLEKWGIT